MKTIGPPIINSHKNLLKSEQCISTTTLERGVYMGTQQEEIKNRCWFSRDYGERSFLQWLITNDVVEEAIRTWNDLQNTKKELQKWVWVKDPKTVP